MRPAILFFVISCCVLLFGFKQQGNIAPDDKVFLDIVAAHDTMTAYDHSFRMAIAQCVQLSLSSTVVSKIKAGTIDTSYAGIGKGRLYNSSSIDTATHGRKIYRLFVRDDNAYANYAGQPTGQFLVKAIWHFETSTKPDPKGAQLVVNDSVYLKPTVPGEYFIMYKAGDVNYTTDMGWVYGIVNAAGNKVIDKGLIKSCMSCHDESRNDRMLGMR